MKLIYVSIISVLLFSCNEDSKTYYSVPTVLAPQEYKAWVKSEQAKEITTNEKKIAEIIYQAEYLPVEKLALRELHGKNNPEALNEAMSHYADMEYFNFKIELENGTGELLKYNLSGQEEYTQRMTYCSFEMQKDVYVEAGGKQIPCSMFHFERAYDVMPFCTFMLAFPKEDLARIGADEWTLVFDDHLFDKGLIKFTFLESSIHNTPKLG